jgi:hypothetical protein
MPAVRWRVISRAQPTGRQRTVRHPDNGGSDWGLRGRRCRPERSHPIEKSAMDQQIDFLKSFISDEQDKVRPVSIKEEILIACDRIEQKPLNSVLIHSGGFVIH